MTRICRMKSSSVSASLYTHPSTLTHSRELTLLALLRRLPLVASLRSSILSGPFILPHLSQSPSPAFPLRFSLQRTPIPLPFPLAFSLTALPIPFACSIRLAFRRSRSGWRSSSAVGWGRWSRRVGLRGEGEEAELQEEGGCKGEEGG
jgi:hypothetical protein